MTILFNKLFFNGQINAHNKYFQCYMKFRRIISSHRLKPSKLMVNN